MNRTTKKLTDIHRAFLVREFACFASPMQAADALREEYGIEITPQSAQHYDATSGAGSRAAKKWHDLFDVSRQAFLDEVSERIPHAHKAVRIKKLARASDAFEKSKNYMAMARMLEQIAKEVGNVHTNRHEFTGRNQGPIKFAEIDDMTDEQINLELKQIFAQNGLKLVPITYLDAIEKQDALTLSSDENRQLCFHPDVHSALRKENWRPIRLLFIARWFVELRCGR